MDFETASTADLKKVGVERYARDPTTRVLVMCWRLDDGPVNRWLPPNKFWPATPQADVQPLLDHVAKGGVVVAHNVAFERNIWRFVLTRYFGEALPPMHIYQMQCTMARAFTLGIPASLDTAAAALRLPERKDHDGYRVMLQMMRPRKTEQLPDGRFVYRWWHDEDQAKYEALIAYCAQDVITECALDKALPMLTERETAVWHMDQVINERGVALDLENIDRLMQLVEIAKDRLNARMKAITLGVVRKCTQVKNLVEWLNSRGIPCHSLAKHEMDPLIERAKAVNDTVAAEAINLRKQASKTSTAKLKTMMECVSADRRARHQIQYHGAAPGRFAGRLIQPHNLYRIDPDRDGHAIKEAIKYVEMKLSLPDLHNYLTLAIEPVMYVVPKVLRSMFVASAGHRLVGGDLKNIEGRLNAEISGEKWKVQAFRDFDAGTGPDLYNLAYARSFGVPLESITKPQRQIGKVEELSLGYQGSVGAFISMAKNYGLKPAMLVRPVQAAVPYDLWQQFWERYPSARDKNGLPQDQWTACKIIVTQWRTANPAITQGWWDLQDAAVEAVASPGEIVPVFDAKVRYLASHGFLWCSLPSGRAIAYLNPQIKTRVERFYRNQYTLELVEEAELGLFPDEKEQQIAAGIWRMESERYKRVVYFEGYDSEAKIWRDNMALYGGMQCNHVVQGTARDVLVECIFNAERAGYTVVLHVHDELMADVPHNWGSKEELADIMTQPLAWLPNLPLAADTWSGLRYAK